jgi:outer membrane lipoprotein carrier protein
MISRKKQCGMEKDKRILAAAPPHEQTHFRPGPSPSGGGTKGGDGLQGKRNGRGWIFAECGIKTDTFARAAGCCVLLLVSSSTFSAAAETASVFTATALTVPSSSVPAAVGMDGVQAIEAHYRDLADLTARVVQKNFLKSVEKTQKFEGTLAIKRPGKLRLEYTNGQLIMIDGAEAWFYSKKSEQAIRRTFKDFEQANIPVAFLLGAGAIRQDFAVSVPEADKPRMLDLVPKKAGAAMRKLRLYSDEVGRITRMVVHDRSGNTSDIQFSDVKENVGLDDGQFRFKVPKGTEIIEQ